MKRIILLSLLLLISLSFLFPVSPTIGSGEYLVIDFEEESDYETVRKALSEPLSLEWYERYTTNDKILISSSSEKLSSLLPFSNYVLLEEKNNAIRAFSLSDGSSITFTFLDGLIHSIAIN